LPSRTITSEGNQSLTNNQLQYHYGTYIDQERGGEEEEEKKEKGTAAEFLALIILATLLVRLVLGSAYLPTYLST
jgi:hypothetical protein